MVARQQVVCCKTVADDLLEPYHSLLSYTHHVYSSCAALEQQTPYCWYLQKPLFVGALLAAHCNMTHFSSLLSIAHVEQQVASVYNTSMVVTL